VYENGGLQPFVPFFRNAHLTTIAGNFWPRRLDTGRYPVREAWFDTEPGVRVLAHAQGGGHGGRDVILLHGLEGSSASGYMVSLAQACLDAGLGAYRLNMRTCGGTEAHARTLYHAGLTADLHSILRARAAQSLPAAHLIGFSLGGNVVLKLAGELRETNLIASVCSVSTPIDLEASCRKMMRPENIFYQRRFVDRLKARYRSRCAQHPDLYSAEGLDDVRSVYEFDDRFTAKAFGFGSAANYYGTQSANRFLVAIRVPTLLIQAKNDPLIPFDCYRHPAIAQNPHLRLMAPEHGGHVGFISRHQPRFWVDETYLGWLAGVEFKGTK